MLKPCHKETYMKKLNQYKAVTVPEQTATDMDKIYKTLKEQEQGLRKADLWLEGVKLLKRKYKVK